jgi:hypothetical protein
MWQESGGSGAMAREGDEKRDTHLRALGAALAALLVTVLTHLALKLRDVLICK